MSIKLFDGRTSVALHHVFTVGARRKSGVEYRGIRVVGLTLSELVSKNSSSVSNNEEG